jgi:hypothetical protein
VRQSRGSAATASHRSASVQPGASQLTEPDYGEQRGDVARVFGAREAALLHDDLQAWLATVDPAQPALVKSETTLFTNLRQLPLQSYTWDYDGKTQLSGYPLPDSVKATLSSPQQVYSPGMTVTYQLRGFDPQPTSDPYVPIMVQRAGRWYVGGDDTRAATFDESFDEPWTAGPVKVRVSAHALVIVSPRDAGRIAALSKQAEVAVAAVASLWPSGWSHKVVLYGTRDRDVFASFLGRNRSVSEASALTLGVADRKRGAADDVRVVMNPSDVPPGDPFVPVLLRHEFTHVAQWNTQAAGTPRWVIEGIAEYTAHRHHLSQAGVSTKIVDDARAHRWPSRMPSSADFYGPEPGETYHYDMAWLAWEYMAERYGEAKVKAMYGRLAQIGTTPDSPAALRQEAAAFPVVLHMSETAFVMAVQAWTARSFHPA